MKLKVKPCKYCNEHAIEISRCPDINPMEPVRMLCTKCNFQIYGATENEAIERWNKEYDLAHKPKGVMIVGMDMPTCHTSCRFYAFHNPKTNLIWCNADTKEHSFKSYETRCDNCPLQEVK